MINVKDVLIRNGIHTDSVIGAIHDLKGKDLTRKQMYKLVKELTGGDSTIQEPLKLQYFISYVLQTSIRGMKEESYDHERAVREAEILTERMWNRVLSGDFGKLYTETEEQSLEDVKAQAAATGRFKKGSKKVLAMEIFNEENGNKADIVQKFQDELDMSKAGATTYFYICKKEVKQ